MTLDANDIVRSVRAAGWSPALPSASGLALSAATCLGVGLVTATSAAQCDTGELTVQELTTQDGQGWEQFGYDVAVSGDVAIVGANEDDDLGMNSGSAYVFRYDGSGWSQEQKLLALDGNAGDMFGLSVSVSGDVAVVGSPRDDDVANNSGAAYVFRLDGNEWVQQQKLTPDDGEAWDWYGTAVAVSGDMMLIGSYADDQAYNSGAVYAYENDGGTWSFMGKLIPSDGMVNGYFGTSLSMSGDVAIIGAYGDHELGSPTGAAYVFRFDGEAWVEEAKIHASDAAALNEFGRDVAISGTKAIVGDPNEGNPGTGLPVGYGAAYVFSYDGSSWNEVAKLTDEEGELQDKFGASVAITNDVAVVGSPADDDAGTQSGSVFVFRYDGFTWAAGERVLAPEGSGASNFGHAVAGFGSDAVVGAAISSSAFMVTSGDGAASAGGMVGDANGDGFVDVDDLIFVLLSWGPCTGSCPGDMNCDDMVTVDDLLEVITNWEGQNG